MGDEALFSQMIAAGAAVGTDGVPQRWRCKPVEVDAMLWDGSAECAATLVRWSEGAVEAFNAGGLVGLRIETLEGVMRVALGDYVVRGLGGEFYPCKPALFLAKYDPV